MKKLPGLHFDAPAGTGLYDPRFEHDACGVGFVANIRGEKSHEIIEKGIEVLMGMIKRDTPTPPTHPPFPAQD